MASDSKAIHTGSDELLQHDCDVCLTLGITSEAVCYCTICCEHICQRCEQSHRGSRATRDHTLVTGSSIPTGPTKTKPNLPFMFCDTHKTSLLDIYCNTHDEVICTMCKMTNHTKCGTIDVSRHVIQSNVDVTVRQVVKNLTDLTDKFNDMKQKRHADKSSMKEILKQCLQDMQQMRKKVNDKLDLLEDKMSVEIRKFEEELSKEIDTHVTITKDVLHQISDLNKSLDECQTSRDDNAMFVAVKRASSRSVEFEKIVMKIQEEISPIDLRFVPNDVLTDVIDQLQSVGTLVADQQTKYSGPTPTSFLNMSVMDKRDVSPRSTCINGCTFMPDGHFVTACDPNGLKLFDRDFQLKSELSIYALDVAAIDDNDVIIIQGPYEKLQIVQVLPNMEVKATLQMHRRCWGVDVYGEEIYVTCYHSYVAPGNGEVTVLSMDGTEQRRLCVDNGEYYLFTFPSRVQVSRDGSKLFVSDKYTHTVTCLNNHGHVIYQYSDTDLKVPYGMCVDKEDNLLVCGQDSRNVHVVRRDGRKEKVLVSKKDGIKYPQYICYRESDGCLVVVGRDVKTTKLFAFQTKID